MIFDIAFECLDVCFGYIELLFKLTFLYLLQTFLCTVNTTMKEVSDLILLANIAYVCILSFNDFS